MSFKDLTARAAAAMTSQPVDPAKAPAKTNESETASKETAPKSNPS